MTLNLTLRNIWQDFYSKDGKILIYQQVDLILCPTLHSFTIRSLLLILRKVRWKPYLACDEDVRLRAVAKKYWLRFQSHFQGRSIPHISPSLKSIISLRFAISESWMDEYTPFTTSLGPPQAFRAFIGNLLVRRDYEVMMRHLCFDWLLLNATDPSRAASIS